MNSDSKISTQFMLEAAEQYLAQTEAYEAVTLKDLAEFLGASVSILYQRFPVPHWKKLQRSWIARRLKKAMDDISKEAITQEEYTVEYIAKYAKIPPKVVRRFLTEEAGRELPTTHRKIIFQDHTSEANHYILQVEKYLELTQQFELVSLEHFAEFLGEPEHIVRKRLSLYNWEVQRDTWIENHLRRAMDAVYTEAQNQDDFTRKSIARYAALPYTIVRRFLPEDEWQALRASLPIARPPKTQVKAEMRHLLLAEEYFAQTEQYEDLTMERFAETMGLPSLYGLKSHWLTLRDKWIEKHFRDAMNAIYAEAKTREDFSFASIARRAGIPVKTKSKCLPKDEWRALYEGLPSKYGDKVNQLQEAMDRIYAEAKTSEDFTMARIAALVNIPDHVAFDCIENERRIRRATLPTTKEKVLEALQYLVDVDTPVRELTKKRIIEQANVNGEGYWRWFNEPYQAALRQLALRPRKDKINPAPVGNVRLIPGGWVDIDDDIWDLRPAGELLVQKERLREDIAEIGWHLLQEELQDPNIPLGTIGNHYWWFLKAGAILGDKVPDVRQATLGAVQRAWMIFNGTQGQRMHARPALVQIFEALMRLAKNNDAIDGSEMFNITNWLRYDVIVGRTKPGGEFLSENELNAVIQACLTDIIAGIEYTKMHPDLLTVSVNPLSKENAFVVVRWAVALMILVMAFTGLRRASIRGLKTNDWAEIRTGLHILAWRHNKKVEENVAVLPVELARHLQLYVQRTAQVRALLEVESVFLGNNNYGHWMVMTLPQHNARLGLFAKYHCLERGGIPLPLNSTVLRRTYATHALYEGRNLAALRSQLGHIHFESTLRYVIFDQYKHPAEVGIPLDEYGRKALTLWRTPQIINELDSDKRASLLSAKVQRNQDVGLCCHSHCVKAAHGSPPPCSLCEYLVTGPEFLVAWEMEYLWRKQELERFAEEPGSEMMLAQMKYQLAHFETNYTFIQRRFHA